MGRILRLNCRISRTFRLHIVGGAYDLRCASPYAYIVGHRRLVGSCLFPGAARREQ